MFSLLIMAQEGYTALLLMQQNNNYYMQTEAARPQARKQKLDHQALRSSETTAQSVNDKNQNYIWPHWKDYNWQPIMGSVEATVGKQLEVQAPTKPSSIQPKEISFQKPMHTVLEHKIKVPASPPINTSIGQPMEDPIQLSLMTIFRDRKLFEDSYTKSTLGSYTQQQMNQENSPTEDAKEELHNNYVTRPKISKSNLHKLLQLEAITQEIIRQQMEAVGKGKSQHTQTYNIEHHIGETKNIASIRNSKYKAINSQTKGSNNFTRNPNVHSIKK